MTYCSLVDLLRKFHYAISQNDCDLRLAVWEEIKFIMHDMEHFMFIDLSGKKKHTLKQRKKFRNSVCQFDVMNTLLVRLLILLVSRHSWNLQKLQIIKFVNLEERIAKWVLSRPYQSMFTEALRDMTSTSKCTQLT